VLVVLVVLVVLLVVLLLLVVLILLVLICLLFAWFAYPVPVFAWFLGALALLNRVDSAGHLRMLADACRAVWLAGATPVGDVRRDELNPCRGGDLRVEHPLHEGLDRQAAQLVR
jgi:hypothetical protein